MPRSHDPHFWLNIVHDVIVPAAAAGTSVLVWYRKRGARYWPMTYGKVEYGLTSDEGGWKVNLMYSYAVGSEFYSGVLPLKVRNETAADAKVSQWKGQNLMVRYSPRDPSISVVRMEDQASLSGGEFRGH